MKKFLSILIIIAFVAPGFAPLAHSMGMGHEGETHYCKHSGGPCKHGDACPVNHHRKKGHERSGHEGSKSKPESKDGHGKHGCNTFIGCADKGHAPQISTALEMPFVTTVLLFSSHDTFEKFVVRCRILYKDPIPELFERPPATA